MGDRGIGRGRNLSEQLFSFFRSDFRGKLILFKIHIKLSFNIYFKIFISKKKKKAVVHLLAGEK